MYVEIHQFGTEKIAEVISDEILIKNAEDGLQIMIDLYYQDFDKIILHEKNIASDFFDLKTGIAGELLQKFSNYKVRLVIVGDFSKHESKSIRDFIYESNKGRQINFLATSAEGIERLCPTRVGP